MYCLLRRAANIFPNKIAIELVSKSITFKELYDLSLKFDNFLKNIPNRVIIVKTSYTPLYIAFIFACIRNNKIYLPLSSKEGTALPFKLVSSLSAFYLEDIDDALLQDNNNIFLKEENTTFLSGISYFRNSSFCVQSNTHRYSDSFNDALMLFIKTFHYGCDDSDNHKGNNDNKNLEDLIKCVLPSSAESYITLFEELVDKYCAFACNIMLSSGSTGEPKKILHCLAAHIYSAIGAQEVFTLYDTDSYLLNLPLNHVGGQAIIFKSIIFGSKIVIKDENVDLAWLLTNDKVSVLSLVPTQAFRLLNDKNNPLKTTQSLRAILFGGAHIESSLVKMLHAQKTNLRVFASYGSTEMASQIATLEIINNITAGFVLPFRDLCIIDNEICVSGKTLALGYVIDDKVLDIRSNDGYFHTKDLGKLSNDGLTVTGRIDNMFISGGENIIPEVVEEALLEIPNVITAFVVPVASYEWGQVAVAFIRFNDDSRASLTNDDFIDAQLVKKIKDELKTKLHRAYIPKYYLHWSSAIDTSFKVKRSSLIELATNILLKHQITL